MIRIRVNERQAQAPDAATAGVVRDRFKPEADILVLNGAVVPAETPVQEGDRICLIRRGERPSPEELETLLVSRHTPGVHDKVKRAVVGIAGLGGLGSTVAIALVRTGVGRLILADFDVVEPSNLNRQQYTVDQIGMYKTDAIRKNLEQINPYVQIETHRVRLDEDNIPRIFGSVDVMVEAFDSAEAKAMLVQTFLRTRPGVPLVTASGLAGYGPSNQIRTRRVLPNLYLVGDEKSAAKPGMGLMAPRVGIAASHQANAVLRLLLGLPVGEAPAPNDQ